MSEATEDTQALPLRRAYPFLEIHGLEQEAQSIRTSKERLGSFTSTLKRGMIVALLRRKGLLDMFVAEHWPNGATEKGRHNIERYARIFERFQESGASEESEDEYEASLEETSFANEEALRDYLARNLHLLEDGLDLWPAGSEASVIEFRVDDSGRRIDILAKDCKGVPVIIELKVSRGHERVIGQTLYYRTRIKDLFRVERARIMIVAREITPPLKAAARDVPDVSLFEYELSMSPRKVWPSSSLNGYDKAERRL